MSVSGKMVEKENFEDL